MICAIGRGRFRVVALMALIASIALVSVSCHAGNESTGDLGKPESQRTERESAAPPDRPVAIPQSDIDDAAIPKEPEPVPGPDDAEAAPDIDTWLERIEARAADVRTLHSKVRHQTIQALLGDEQVRVGDLFYAAPDEDADQPNERLAVHFQRELIGGAVQPVDRWLIFDGRWLLDIDYEKKQATRRQLAPEDADGDDARAALPIPIRLNREEVQARYAVAFIAPEDPRATDVPEDAIGLRFTPHPGNEAEPFDAWFDTETMLPVLAVTGDPDGDLTRILLYQTTPNADVPLERLTTLPPDAPGWDVQIVPLDDTGG